MTVYRPWISLACLFALAIAAACSPLPILNAVVPTDGYHRTVDIAYGGNPRQKLDVYAPHDTAGAKLKPVVVFFYGGRWDSGDRADYRFAAEALTSQGIVTVVPDYRVYPEVRFPDFVHDAVAAVRWTKDNAARFGGDANRLYVMGHSAGAHIAALLTLDDEYLKRVGMRPRDLRGMIGLAGPYDFLPLTNETLTKIFGPEEERGRSQPVNYVNGANPPMLLLVGNQDTLVEPGNTTRLAAKIVSAGGPVQVVEFPEYGHADMVAKLAAPLRGNGDLLKAVADFVHGPR